MQSPDTTRTAMEAIAVRRLAWRSPAVHMGPWRCDGWVVTTDGHVLVAVRPWRLVGECAEIPSFATTLARDFLDRPNGDPVTVRGGDLKAFGLSVSPPWCATCQNSRRVECEDCDGAGEESCTCRCGHEHEADCDTCDGRGDRGCPDCTPDAEDECVGRLLEVPINRVRLRDVLSVICPADEEPIAVSLEPHGEHRVFLLRGVDWMALVMPMQNVTPTADFAKPDTWQRRASPMTAAGDASVTDRLARGPRSRL